ncbi:MAG: ABC-F family ATP-binding cassette domain-containing protein [Bacteroidales bacterium]|nr:ABC-F family ATP-binding cassette domain-containing protein [Bacteroidales bacterium]
MADALLTVENLTKSFGDKLLFENISFGINAGQKSALIARNGYGKSTLLNILMTAYGERGYNTLQDSGKITFRGDLKLAYLPQGGLTPNPSPIGEGSSMHGVSTPLSNRRGAGVWLVRDLVYSVQRPETEDEWTFEQRMEEILSRMKVDHLLDRPMDTLSGGEQKKVALCRLLIDDCNLLILDEPTNHLDIDMIEWLEDFLSRQRLAILMVTHDRYFLDNVCDNIYELDNARLYHYRGHYDYYLEKKAEREANERAEVEKARSLYRTELEWMRRMPQARGTKAQARIDAFYELEAKAHTRFDDSRPQLTVKTERIGGKILELYNISLTPSPSPIGEGGSMQGVSTPLSNRRGAGGEALIDDFSYVFKRGEKIGIVGPNGVGKSTFLNIITERLKPTSGRVIVGQTIQFGYYTQAGMSAPADRRVIDLVKDIAEEIELDNGKSMSAHQFLTYFGFDGTTQYNYFGNLSGGEKRRLYLLQVLMANPNFLILDEPTNDLDIYTLQILEQFLQTYKGCLVIVSHDRSFMDHIVDHIFVFEGKGKIKDYHSNYTAYRMQKAQQQRETTLQQRTEKPKYERSKSEKRKPTYKEQKEYEALTAEIEALTAEKATLEQKLSEGTMTDPAEITRVSSRIGELMALLDEKELRWLELDELM